MVWRCTDWLTLNLQRREFRLPRLEQQEIRLSSLVKTAIKKVDAAVAAKDVETAKACSKAAIATMSKATSKGVYHKNTTSRKISRLTKAVNSIA